MANQPLKYLDDLIVGTEYHSTEYTLSAEQIVNFARQFDPQVFHLNAEEAKDTFFHELVASGWHTAAITMKLLVNSLPFANGLIGAGAEIKWLRPTRPNDTLRVVSKILDIRHSNSKPDRGIVIVENRTLNQDEELCQRLITKVVVMRRPEV